jgi:hypothetical protein
MGSGYKNFTAGAVLTASDVNNHLMEQSVMYFATTAARDAALSGRLEDGMTVYQGTNDANEGLWSYHGSAWRRPWNIPWGVVSQTQAAAGASPVSAETVVATGPSTTFLANRRYRWLYQTTFVGNGGGDIFQVKLRANNTAGTTYSTQRFVVVGPVFQGISNAIAILSPGATTFTPVATFERIAGSGTCGTAVEFVMTIEDIGPSGAPV